MQRHRVRHARTGTAEARNAADARPQTASSSTAAAGGIPEQTRAQGRDLAVVHNDGELPVLAYTQTYTQTWRYDEDAVSYSHAWIIKPDGRGKQRIREHTDTAYEPRWSPRPVILQPVIRPQN